MHNSARFVTGTRRPMFHPMIQSMPTAPSIGSQNRMSLTQPTGSSFGTPASSFRQQSYGAHDPMFPPTYGAPRSMLHAALHPSNPTTTSCSSSIIKNPYVKRDVAHGAAFLFPHPTSKACPKQHSAVDAASQRGPFGGTGGQLPNDLTPSCSSSIHAFPSGGLSMFSIASDSLGSPFTDPPDQEFMTGISYAASSSSSAGSSSLIDLQQADRETTTEHDAIHASPAPGLLSTLAVAASEALTKLPSSSHQQNEVRPPEEESTTSSTTDPLPTVLSYSTAELARFVLQSDNLYGTTDITRTTRQLETVTTRHKAKCDQYLQMIFTLLANHPSREMQYLAEDAKDPDTGLLTKRFWLHLSGEPTEAKKQLLNAILIIFSHWYRKVEYRGRNTAEMTDEEIAQVCPLILCCQS